MLLRAVRNVQQAAEDLALNSSYSNGQGRLRGIWTLRSPGGLSTTFNLEEVADRLLALEVASFWAAAKDAAAENSRRYVIWTCICCVSAKGQGVTSVSFSPVQLPSF